MQHADPHPRVYQWSRRDPQADLPEGHKRCRDCGQVKPATVAHWRRKSSLAFAQPCLECQGKR